MPRFGVFKPFRMQISNKTTVRELLALLGGWWIRIMLMITAIVLLWGVISSIRA